MMQKWVATKTDSVQFEGFNLKNKIDRQYHKSSTLSTLKPAAFHNNICQKKRCSKQFMVHHRGHDTKNMLQITSPSALSPPQRIRHHPQSQTTYSFTLSIARGECD